MKQFIVLLAVFPLMMVFLLQFTAQQNTDYRIRVINETVDTACEEARTTGCFTEDSISSLKARLAEVTGCSADQVKIQASTETKYRTGVNDEREMISFRISLPVGALSAVPGIFGISEEDNSMIYVLENTFPSERLL